MSKKPTAKHLEQVANVFGGMAASNMIGKAMQMALDKGYTGITILFVKEAEQDEAAPAH